MSTEFETGLHTVEMYGGPSDGKEVEVPFYDDWPIIDLKTKEGEPSTLLGSYVFKGKSRTGKLLYEWHPITAEFE